MPYEPDNYIIPGKEVMLPSKFYRQYHDEDHLRTCRVCSQYLGVDSTEVYCRLHMPDKLTKRAVLEGLSGKTIKDTSEG
jgi:hypothetical protein